jgi:hypothetical protein
MGEMVGAHYGRGAWPLAWKGRPESQLKKLFWLASGVLPLRQKRSEAAEKARWLEVCRNLIEVQARASSWTIRPGSTIEELRQKPINPRRPWRAATAVHPVRR